MRTGKMCFLLLLVAAMSGIGPLPERALEQVQSANDFSRRLDAGALYPLLEDALTWQAGDESGAAIPDYAAIMADPAEHRGKVFLIEGELARVSKAGKLVRRGEWDGKLEQWVIKHGETTDDPALVYLVDPPAEARAGQRVRLPARFYMVMSRPVEDSDEEADFLAFIGKSAQLQGGASDGGTALGPVALLVAVLVVMGIVFTAMRTRLKAKPIERRRLSHHETIETDEVEVEDEEATDAPPLPGNPGDALDELRRRHEE